MQMSTVTGTVKSMVPRTGSDGQGYLLVHMAGDEDGLFDWSGIFARAGVRVGDQVNVECGDGRFPRVKSVSIVRRGDGGTGDTAPQADQANGKLGTRDLHIIRMTCLKASSCLLQGRDLDADARAERVTSVAEMMEQ